MQGWPERIVIVGGGTAGWLSALVIGDAARRAGRPCAITVIESSKLGTIGVGEGTTAVFRQMLQHLGIDEMQFLRETDATIKYGIRHRDWRRLGYSYDGPIDDPHLVAGGDRRATFLDTYQIAHARPVGETHLFQYLMERRKSPFGGRAGRRVPLGPFHHAYHFDQTQVGAFLRRQAAGVSLIDDQVTAVQRDAETGDIAALALEGGGEVTGDLFLDCTGFRRRLIAEMGADWVSYADVLPVNRAMPFWLDIAPGEEIDPFTLAWAQGSGWLWKIPTARRYGCGYVYSDLHLTPDQAQAEIETRLGHPIEPRNDIRIGAGRLSETWIGNCVALGLSSAFLEPLEATSIHGTVVQLMLLTTLLGKPSPKNPERYNAAVARQVDDFRDFIRLHYVSERRDTPFWRDVAATHPDPVTRRLELWSRKTPGPEDFAPFPLGLPHVGHHLLMPVLDGLGLLTPAVARAELAARPKVCAHARRTAADLIREYRIAAGRAEGHRHLLDSLTEEFAA
jgi:2-polyprenyl-6-methoxyphenol hydroxylase-like FAD-dependent oxidoreductase